MFPLWQSVRSEWRLSASMNQRKRKTGRVSWSIGSSLYSVLRTSVYTPAVYISSIAFFSHFSFVCYVLFKQVLNSEM
jgi:hypothetical protein